MSCGVLVTGTASIEDIAEARVQSACSAREGGGATAGGEAAVGSAPQQDRSLV
jgi:hypothetical protein